MAAQLSSDPAAARRVLDRMFAIRRFEEALVDMSGRKLFKSHYHLYIGQEATAAVAVEALRKADRLVTTHRNHGHILARGADAGRAFAEILGRATGLNGGRGGTLHLCDPDNGFLATSSVVGGCIGLALGGAFAAKRRGKRGVSVAFFGDGSLEEGISFEAMNIAALWKLPILMLCENNGAGATGSSQGGFPSSVISAPKLSGIPKAMAVKAVVVDGRDVDAVHAAVAKGVRQCRAGKGPFFIEAVTQRWAGSKLMWPEISTGTTDITMAWDDSRIRGEHEDWFRNQDPILLFARKLIAAGTLSKDAIAALDREVSARMDAAAQFAIDSPMPKPETAVEKVFA